MIGHSDEHLLGSRSQNPPLGLNDALLCLGLLIFLIVVSVVVAPLIVTGAESAIAQIPLPPFVTSPN